MPGADAAVERALRAFAASAAGEIAHELNNRLATMHETVGLLEDLARAGKGAAAGTARAHASLDDQVGKALNLVRALATLGGALGPGAQAFDAGAAAQDLLALGERWARRHALRLVAEIGTGLPQAAGDPAIFLCLLHRLLARCAGALAGGGDVRVRVAREADRVIVRVVPAASARAADTDATADEEGIDRLLAERLGGEVLHEEGGAATIGLATIR